MSDVFCSNLEDHSPHAWGDLEWCPGVNSLGDQPPEGDYLDQLQAEADKYGWHQRLRAWVGDDSSVARVLRARETA